MSYHIYTDKMMSQININQEDGVKIDVRKAGETYDCGDEDVNKPVMEVFDCTITIKSDYVHLFQGVKYINLYRRNYYHPAYEIRNHNQKRTILPNGDLEFKTIE